MHSLGQNGAGWGKAEADSATGEEGAESEKTTSHGGVKGPGEMKERNASDAGASGGEKKKSGEAGNQAGGTGGLRLVGMTEVEGDIASVDFRQQVAGPLEITGLPRTKEGGFVSELAFRNVVYPSVNPKVAEGGPIGHKTRLSPPLSRLRRGDKDGASIMGGVVGRGEGVQRALGPLASRALACRGLRSFFPRLGTNRRERRGRRGAKMRHGKGGRRGGRSGDIRRKVQGTRRGRG